MQYENSNTVMYSLIILTEYSTVYTLQISFSTIIILVLVNSYM